MRTRRLKHTLAVSTIVANMLMIAITLSLAAILVAWAGTTYGAFSSGSQLFFVQRGQALQERFVVENVFFNNSQNYIRVFVRNVGVQEIRVVAIYVNGTTPNQASGGTCTVPGVGGPPPNPPVLITVGGVCEFRLAWTSWTSGAVYNFVVATARGNQVTYAARGP